MDSLRVPPLSARRLSRPYADGSLRVNPGICGTLTGEKCPTPRDARATATAPRPTPASVPSSSQAKAGAKAEGSNVGAVQSGYNHTVCGHGNRSFLPADRRPASNTVWLSMDSHLLSQITIPLFTGAIGYLTNWSGVWMLFYPVQLIT